MKTVALQEEQLINGRIRRKGEVMLVQDSFKGKVINTGVEVKNLNKIEVFKLGATIKEKEVIGEQIK